MRPREIATLLADFLAVGAGEEAVRSLARDCGPGLAASTEPEELRRRLRELLLACPSRPEP